MDRFGTLAAVGAAVLFGASVPAARALLGSIDPWVLAGLLYLGSGVGLTAVLVLRRAGAGATAGAPIRTADLPRLVPAVASGGVAGPVLLLFGLSGVGAGTASLLLNLEGLATMGIAWLVLREATDRRLVVGALAILAGGIVLALPGSGGAGHGAWLEAAACLCWGIDNNLTRDLSHLDPIRLALIKWLATGSVNLAFGRSIGGMSPHRGVLFSRRLRFPAPDHRHSHMA